MSKHEWISVESSLPDEANNGLLFENVAVWAGGRIHYPSYWDGSMWWYVEEGSTVTHWMYIFPPERK